MADGDVQFEVREGTGYLRLMRPTALNALSPQMIAVITEQLSAWRDDASVQALDISGEGRAYCAGADVRWMRSTMIENGVQSALEFLADEYAMDAVVAQFGKPVTTHLHGVAMGADWDWACTGPPAWPPPTWRWRCPRWALGCGPTSECCSSSRDCRARSARGWP